MATMDSESAEYCLRWKKYELNFRTFFADLLENESLVDVSLVTQEGLITSAHRVVLSACSPYFQHIFRTIPNNPHPVIVLKDVAAVDLQSILCFMYKGTVNVSQNRVNGIIAIASSLQVKGLSTAPVSPDTSGLTQTGFATLGNPPPANSTPTTAPALKPILPRSLPNLRPSPDTPKVSQKRKYEENQQTSNETDEAETGGNNETDYYGKPPPLLSQPTHTKFMPQQTSSLKLEQMEPTFAVKDENDDMSDGQFMDDAEEDDDDAGDEGFLSSPKTLENLGGVDFVDDTDYSEALEFVQQEGQFLGESSSSAGQHFMTGTGGTQEQTKKTKKKSGTSETRRFKCNTCGNLYAKKSGLTRHMRSAHAGLNSVVCNLCNKSYSRSDILTKHKRRVHNVNNSAGENSAIQGFNSVETITLGQYNKYSHLNRHLQTHSDPRFQCDKCLKLFVRKDVLRRHLIEVHNVVVQNCKVK